MRLPHQLSASLVPPRSPTKLNHPHFAAICTISSTDKTIPVVASILKMLAFGDLWYDLTRRLDDNHASTSLTLNESNSSAAVPGDDVLSRLLMSLLVMFIVSMRKIYEHVPTGHIRLFEPDPGSERGIVGRLQVVPLASAPRFIAISYVCGTEACKRSISVNECDLLVTPNTYAALEEVCNLFHRAGTRTLVWIDAVCIDQANDKEKAKQIGQMHRVFSQADQVRIWLGPLPEDVHLMLDVCHWVGVHRHFSAVSLWLINQLKGVVGHYMLRGLDSVAKELLTGFWACTKRLQERHGVGPSTLRALAQFLRRLEGSHQAMNKFAFSGSDVYKQNLKRAMVARGMKDLFPADHPFWSGLYSFRTTEWFERMWTYQEILLARRQQLVTTGLNCP